MRFFVIRMGDSFEQAKIEHGDNCFFKIEDAIAYGKLQFDPGQRFWVCDENGGVLVLSQVPPNTGNV